MPAIRTSKKPISARCLPVLRVSAKTRFIRDLLFRVAAEGVGSRTATTESAAHACVRLCRAAASRAERQRDPFGADYCFPKKQQRPEGGHGHALVVQLGRRAGYAGASSLAARDDPAIVDGSAITASFSARHHACFAR
jgi:hypothetical protein